MLWFRASFVSHAFVLLQFSELDDATLAFLKEPANKEELQAILKYHVLPVLVPASSIQVGDKYDTVEGNSLEFENVNGSFMIGESTVAQADILGSNGIIHIIDSVLSIPEAMAPSPVTPTAPSPTTPTAPSLGDGTSAATTSNAFGFVLALAGAAAILV